MGQMKKYYTTVELTRSFGITFEAESDEDAIVSSQQYADSLPDEEFCLGGCSKDWELVDTDTNRVVVPFGDVL